MPIDITPRKDGEGKLGYEDKKWNEIHAYNLYARLRIEWYNNLSQANSNDLLAVYDKSEDENKNISVHNLKVGSWKVISEDKTLEISIGYLINTSNSEITLNLPSSPVEGSSVSIKDFKGNASNNNITLDTMGNNIEGESTNFVIYSDYHGMQLVYTDDETGWVRVYESYGAATYR